MQSRGDNGEYLPSVLTIAGSDSGGGAGIQADLRTFSAFRVYGCSAITAVTAQNPAGVRRVDILEAGAVRSQLESIMELFPVRAAKTGMLANRETVECVAEALRSRGTPLVVDPVMVATSGAPLLEHTAIASMRDKLFPLASWITPNIPEAELLCGRKLNTPEELAAAALQLGSQYGCSVILKSGHALKADQVPDVVNYRGALYALTSPRADAAGQTTHGTGCTLSAALTANLALGKEWQAALMAAKAFVYGSLCEKRAISGTLSQMYPPENSYAGRITLKPL
jgi:hydroxymethylpyrimidine/phosphomethylpyrimidine kinase